MKLTIPIPEKVTANRIYSGVHWGFRKKVVDKYHKAINNKKNTKITKYPIVLVVTFYFKNRPLDCSNCFFMTKCIEDGLVHAKVLIDDSPDYVESLTCRSRVDKKNPRIEIEWNQNKKK